MQKLRPYRGRGSVFFVNNNESRPRFSL